MPRLALKPDSSFFRKIVLGAVGSRSVAADMARHGHRIAELERGALDTKLWKEVKRKRVRIPDLVCERCGLRIESRAKTKAELSMSHSPTDEERAWDFGMVDSDLIAFPVCSAEREKYWSAGKLEARTSYWHERNWIEWQPEGHINYVRVRAFRGAAHAHVTTKGVTEGSETSIAWKAIFSSRKGVVETIDGRKITVRRESDGHRHTRTIPGDLDFAVAPGEAVQTQQILAAVVKPESDLHCPGHLPDGQLEHLLQSRERTQRFTGVKLARMRGETSVAGLVRELEGDQEEDVYIRLEAASYLASVGGQAAEPLFAPYLGSPDPQTQLESVIALGEAKTPECVVTLSEILDEAARPYFARSAAAWCLSRIGGDEACRRLVRAFSDVDVNLREEALEGVVSISTAAVPFLLAGLREIEPSVAAGCAEALRQHGSLSDDALRELTEQLASENPSAWAVWLAGNLPRERLAGAIAQLQETAPRLHYAVTLLWSFVESWIARRWELHPGPMFPSAEDAHEV